MLIQGDSSLNPPNIAFTTGYSNTNMGSQDEIITNAITNPYLNQNNQSVNQGGPVPSIPGGPVGNNLITNNSGLHADAAGNAGHSLNGLDVNNVVQNYANYNDGITNPLPSPTNQSVNQGGVVSTIPGGPAGNNLITENSGLHADAAGNAGYSLNGSNTNNVIQNYANYNDDVPNSLPIPSVIDTNGVIPATSNHNNFAPGSSTQALPYMNNLPI